MVGPDFKKPKAPPVSHYTREALPEKTQSAPSLHGGAAQHFTCAEIPLQWWKLFQSPEVNALVVEGLNHHPSIEAGKAAIAQAQAALRAQVGSLFPQIDFVANVTREKNSTSGFGNIGISSASSSSSASAPYTLYNPQFNVSYVLDIFGGNRRAIEGLCAQVDYQKYQLEGIHLTLSSNIVLTAITAASLDAQIKSTHELISLEEKTLEIVKKQFELGGASKQDVLNQEATLAQLKTTLPALELSFRQAQNALSQLTGRLPSQGLLPSIELAQLHLPEALPISLPSELVRHRPDLRAQEALLHQASAQIGVKTAALLPQVTLSAMGGWEALELDQLFNAQNNFWSLGASLLQPIFHGGTLVAQRQQAVAAYQQALAQYKVTVLNAFQNVADSLNAIEIAAQALKAFREAEIAAQQSYLLTEKQYQLGATPFLNLLTAKRTYDQAVISRVQAQAQRYSDTVALFQALGGAWWTS